jgi:predicted enzyme related to lactoylglutathione lyase
MPSETRSISVHIAVAASAVYAYARQPGNLPHWASGLASGIRSENGDWFADSPMGAVKVQMAAANPYGVLDHDVTLPDGRVFHNPLRAIANGDGCDLTFTLFRSADMNDAAFAADAATVARDLQALKALLETRPSLSPASFNDQRIDYLELAVRDIARAKAFYGQAFGWTFKDYGPAYCEFSDGRLSGGFAHADIVLAHGGPLIVLYADALERTLAAVEAAGGRISHAIFDFPGGRRFHFHDPEGYELAVWSRH